MQDYVEDLLSSPEDYYEDWDAESLETDIDEEDELDECGSF